VLEAVEVEGEERLKGDDECVLVRGLSFVPLHFAHLLSPQPSQAKNRQTTSLRPESEGNSDG